MTWLEPWHALSDDARRALEQELHRELRAGHPLYQVVVRAIARRSDTDDVLFALSNHPYQVAVVHLVWHGPQPAPWPDTRFYADFDTWVEDGMKLDHAAYVKQM